MNQMITHHPARRRMLAHRGTCPTSPAFGGTLVKSVILTSLVGLVCTVRTQAQTTPSAMTLLQQAKAGSAVAQFNVAADYFNGNDGFPRNQSLASLWLKRSAAQGLRHAEVMLGFGYANGKYGLRPDPTKALIWIKRSAAQGDSRAEFILGDAYDSGEFGLRKDPTKAASWLMRSAEQGYRLAEFNIGFAYGFGRYGLRPDPAKAGRWFKKSAAQGVPRAEYELGHGYAFGRFGLRPDRTKALSWFRKAAAQGNKPAIAALHEMLRSQQMAVAHLAPQSAPTAVAPPADRQHVVQSLQSFWDLYFSASDAHVVDFGAPALVRPVGFEGAGS